MADTKVTILIEAIDDASRVFNDVLAHSDSMANKLSRGADVFRGMGEAVTDFTKPLEKGLTTSKNAAIGFESEMAEVAKTTGFSAKQVEQIGRTTKKLSREIPITTSGLNDIAVAAGQSGIALKDTEGFIKDVSKAATAFYAGGSSKELEQGAQKAALAFGKLSNVFGIPINKIEPLAAAINVLGDTSIASEKDILNAMTRTAGLGVQAKVTAKELAAMNASMISLGMAPQVAATATNALLSKLTTAEIQSARFQKGLAKVGISAQEMQQSVQAGGSNAVLKLSSALDKLDPVTRSAAIGQLFGAEHSDNVGIFLERIDQYKQMLGSVANDQSNVNRYNNVYAAQLDTTASKMQLLQNSFHELAIEIGTALLPAIRAFAAFLTPIINKVSEFAAKHPNIVRLGSALAGLAISLGPLLFGLSAILKALSLFNAGIPILSQLSTRFLGIGHPVSKFLNWLAKANQRLLGVGKASDAINAPKFGEMPTVKKCLPVCICPKICAGFAEKLKALVQKLDLCIPICICPDDCDGKGKRKRKKKGKNDDMDGAPVGAPTPGKPLPGGNALPAELEDEERRPIPLPNTAIPAELADEARKPIAEPLAIPAAQESAQQASIANAQQLTAIFLAGTQQLTTTLLASAQQLSAQQLANAQQLTATLLASAQQLSTQQLASIQQLTTAILTGAQQLTTTFLVSAQQLAATQLASAQQLTATLLASVQQLSAVFLTNSQQLTTTLLASIQQLSATFLANAQQLAGTLLISAQQLGASAQQAGLILVASAQEVGTALMASIQGLSEILSAAAQQLGAALQLGAQEAGSILVAAAQDAGSILIAAAQEAGAALSSIIQEAGAMLAEASSMIAASAQEVANQTAIAQEATAERSRGSGIKNAALLGLGGLGVGGLALGAGKVASAVGGIFGGIGKAVGGAVGAVGAIGGVAGKAVGAIGGAAGAIGGAAKGLGGAVAGLAGKAGPIGGAIVGAGKAAAGAVGGAGAAVGGALKGAAGAVGGAASGALSGLAGKAAGATGAIGGTIMKGATGALGSVIAPLKSGVAGLGSLAGGAISAAKVAVPIAKAAAPIVTAAAGAAALPSEKPTNTISKFSRSSASPASDLASTSAAAAKNNIVPLTRSSNESGKAIASGLAKGIESNKPQAELAAAGLAQGVSSYLPRSPAEKGPLSDLDKTGSGLTKEFIKGIDGGALENKLGKAMNPPSKFKGIATAKSAGNSSSNAAYSPTYNISASLNGDTLVGELEKHDRKFVDWLAQVQERFSRGRY